MDSLGRREGGTRPASRRYADPTSFLMPAQRWAADREELAVTFGRPLDATGRLAELEADQHAQLQRLQAAIDAGDGVRLHAGRVVIDPVTADPVDAGTQRLATELTAACRAWTSPPACRAWSSPSCCSMSTPGRNPALT